MDRRYLQISLLTVMLLGAHSGCVWHGESADHLWGPTLFRIATPPDSQAFLAEQAWLPLLVEGGTRWGITIGYFSKLLSVPLAFRQTAEPASQNRPLAWSSLAAIPIGSWRISPFHTSIQRAHEAEFVVKRIVGLQLSTALDREGSNMTFGTSRTSRFWPHPDALYLLEFSSDRPLATRFLVCDAEPDESLEPCLQEVIR
ncbi:MAG: hypothetical protein OJF47_001486 [Nitrospira sp.]|jgi:hypothetical protein|nr:MAG: hypothetical protein OJF47_001486 [Nitrospira sp.]